VKRGQSPVEIESASVGCVFCKKRGYFFRESKW